MTASNNQLAPQTLRGFNDWFAADVKLRNFVINTFVSVFEKYGYEPLETPALEYTQFMAGISGSEAEKQFYRFQDPGGRDVMLKYEVMTAMCRAVAANINNLVFPYKRYQIQPVWRAENTQKGRYRQFTQCDADTIGSPSMLADAEFIQMGLEIVQKLGFQKFLARISNRKILEGLREYLQIPADKFYGMCMSVDKLAKIGLEGVQKELTEVRQIDPNKVKQVIEIVQTNDYRQLNNSQILNNLTSTIGQTPIGRQGLEELGQIFELLGTSQIDPQLYRLDISIARGLASYTGPVWEYEVIDGGVGSIGGCGRYDNVIGRYLNQKSQIPATGGSFGIERICDIIKDRQMLSINSSPAQVMITIFSSELRDESLKLANRLRAQNISTLLYPDPDKLSKQFGYANAKKIPYVATIGPDEIQQNLITLKNLATGDQKQVSFSELITTLSNA
jgi:histidyl-tRNA synthetase